MTLIDNDILPVILAKLKPILQDKIVGRYAYIPLRSSHDPKSLCSGVGVALVNDLSDRRGPFLELCHPVGYGREGSNDKERAKVLFEFNQIAEQSNSLDSLSQAHFISKDSVEIVIVKRH